MSRLLFAATVAVAVLGACSDDDEDGVDQRSVLRVGEETCLSVDGTFTAEVTDLPVVDCDGEHTHEIFARVAATVDDFEVYPGFAALESFAERVCYDKFEDYVKVSPFDSELYISWLVPTLDGWNQENDRTVLCVLARFDGEPLQERMRDSRT